MHYRFSAALAFALFVAGGASAGPQEDSLLAGAAARLDVKGVELALRRGAVVDRPLANPVAPSVMRTPLVHALLGLLSDKPDAPKKAETILRALFKAGAKLTGDQDELFPAIAGGHASIVRLLLEEGANPHQPLAGYTPAELAIKHRQTKLLPLFYARGVPRVDAATTAQIQLVHAAGIRNLKEMRAAVQAGAKVNDPDPSGALALTRALSIPLIDTEDYEAILWLLLDGGADPAITETGDRAESLMHLLVARNLRGPDPDAVAALAKALLSRGAPVSAVDFIGRTPLHLAAEAGSLQLVETLLRAGAKANQADRRGRTALDVARSPAVVASLRAALATEVPGAGR